MDEEDFAATCGRAQAGRPSAQTGGADDLVNSGWGGVGGGTARGPSAVDESQLVEKRKSSSPQLASDAADSLPAVSRRTFSFPLDVLLSKLMGPAVSAVIC